MLSLQTERGRFVSNLVFLNTGGLSLLCIFSKYNINDNPPAFILSDLYLKEPVQHSNNIKNIITNIIQYNDGGGF